MKIIVVEDEPFMRAALAAIMENYGTCTAVGDGMGAIAAFSGALESEMPFDLMTLDIQMPDMDGKEVLVKVREIEKIKNIPAERRIKILMLSGHAEEEHLTMSLKAGCDGYILKPFSRKVVEEKLRDLKLL